MVDQALLGFLTHPYDSNYKIMSNYGYTTVTTRPLYYWVDKKVMEHFSNFFSTYTLKDYIQHLILTPNGSFSLRTFKFKSYKSI